MRYLLFLLTLIFIFSCSPTQIDENGRQINLNPEEETTMKLLNNMDTSQCYYIHIDHIEPNNTPVLYAINSSTNTVEYKITDQTGEDGRLHILLLSIIIIFVIGLIALIPN